VDKEDREQLSENLWGKKVCGTITRKERVQVQGEGIGTACRHMGSNVGMTELLFC
jgi:hypothetical protein